MNNVQFSQERPVGVLGKSPVWGWRDLALASGSGLMMGMAIAPLNAWMLAWVALAPLWVMLRQPRPRWQRAVLGAAWSIGYNGLAIAWIRDLHPLTWLGVPWLGSVAIALFAWGAIVFWSILRVLAWVFCVELVYGWSRQAESGRQAVLRLGGAIALWGAIEVLWSHSPLDWTPLAVTQSPGNLWLLHLGQLSGPTLVSCLLVACNGLLAEAWLHRAQASLRQRWGLTAAGLLLVGHGLGLFLFLQPLALAPSTQLKIGIIQGNIPTRIKLFETGLQQAISVYTQGYETLVAAGADAVITPEGSFPWRWVDTPRATQNPFYQAIQSAGVPVWVGSFGQREGRLTQTLFSLDGRAQMVGRYDKVKLVPLGEYIPLESLVGRFIQRLSTFGDSMRPGSSHQVFETPFGRAIAAICYDSAFPYLFRDQAASGGQFILTASNNDPYKRAMMAQHHAQDVMRAIETSRYAVRATNTGFSGLVDPHGKTLWISGFQTTETYLATLYRRQVQTPYVRWGNWFTPIFLVLALLSQWRWGNPRPD